MTRNGIDRENLIFLLINARVFGDAMLRVPGVSLVPIAAIQGGNSRHKARDFAARSSYLGNENGGSASSEGGRDGVTRVKFVLQRQCMFGEHFKVIGGHPALGEWDPRAAIPLEWSDGHNWTTELDVPQGSVFEYKFVLQCQNGWIHWQPGPNRVFSTPEKKPSLVVSQTWDFDAKGMEDGDATEAREESLSGAEEARGKSMLETEAPQETMADTEARGKSMLETEAPQETMADTEARGKSMLETEAPQETMPDTEARGKSMLETEAPQETMPDTEARGKSMLETEAPQETMPDTEAREEGTALASEGGDQAAISSLESRQLGEQAGSDSEQEEQEEQEQAFEACIELPDTLPNFDSAKVCCFFLFLCFWWHELCIPGEGCDRGASFRGSCGASAPAYKTHRVAEGSYLVFKSAFIRF
ncbi:uncharacterized protein LOC9655306 isoform X1 [Selaginella moellendorffii]|uniref:uncharacterized protein LOC9655306 isoform X1 n=1 Tax=Selaginella moellendorffii TaxID=88036 RepID=UPI000D1CF739|nr:uncharacterized protein LOC9655306 isoform X1 [Selaginella moellendorffii]|eukprot:XP_024524326.1 uncharacterized protein LOC9655306 isoform X1 [Selaginella moellendorffii]